MSHYSASAPQFVAAILLFQLSALAVDAAPPRARSLRISRQRHVDCELRSGCDCGRWTCPICQSQCDCPGCLEAPPEPPPDVDEAEFPEEAEPDSSALDQFDTAAITQSLGVGAESFAAAPNMIGDFFGVSPSLSTISRVYSMRGRGFIITGTSGDPNSSLVYEVGGGTTANDLFTVGLGRDNLPPSPDADTFDLAEPVPPSDAPMSPGPGFRYAGGTAVNPRGTFDNAELWDIVYGYNTTILIPPGGGLVVGRMKIAENTSPIPRDRIFFNYSLFDNVPLADGGVTVHRYTPGFEKTFLDGDLSFEMRMPFASTLSSTLSVDGALARDSTEFGNLFMAVKALLVTGDNCALSCGLSFTAPTADDTHIGLGDGTPLVEMRNESVNLMPFVGWLLMSADSRWFTQGFLQIDVDANGDPVRVNQIGDGLVDAGRIQETSFLYLDVGLGYWLQPYDPARRSLIRGIAPTVELHYNRSLHSSDFVRSGNFLIGQPLQDIQVLNAVLGATLQIGRASTITTAYAAPIGNGHDQQFDGELRALWNRFY